ncbi:hypothetical protein [Nocardia macrotermitis]|uniref:Uncharacterized protein n=1 Tax=Nocardia macrotermitis TaxID=2585198 RepID=A0A7K0D909_9NOCA|nr:hypothetical protein [Nocardia macrotermitis]MQY22089.1 hypothetical protein [Nocardia macrotermitis]
MDNPHPTGNRPMSVAPDPGRVRTPEPTAPRGRRHSLADVLAAVMLLLATLAYLGRLVWGLSQPGYEIQARDFGSLLAAIIAIPAGVLLVTGMKPAVGRLTGALGAGAMLLFNAVNLAGGSVDDVIGKYGTWAAIPIVVATTIAIIALYRASWSPEEQVVADDRREVGEDRSRQYEDEFDSPRYQDDYAGRARREEPAPASRSGLAGEQAAGVIGGFEAEEPEAAAAPVLRSPFSAPPQVEPLFGESSPGAPELSNDEVPQEFSRSEERAADDFSSLALPGMSLPGSSARPGPVEEFAPEPPPAQDGDVDFAVSGPGGSAAWPQPVPGGAPQPSAPEPYVPERLTARPPESLAPQPVEPEPAVSDAVPQQVPFAVQTPPTEPFAQQDPALFHAATDGIPTVSPADPPTTVLPRPDFTANSQQAVPPMVEPPVPGAVIGAPTNVEPERHNGFGTPPPFLPAGNEPGHPGNVIAPGNVVLPNMHAPETAPLNMGRPGGPQPLAPQPGPVGPPRGEMPPVPQRPDVPAGPPRNGVPDGVPPQPNNPPQPNIPPPGIPQHLPQPGNPQPGNPQPMSPPPGNGPVHQPFGPPQNTPYPADTAQQNSLRLPGAEPFPPQGGPRQPVLRQPGGFLAPPPVEPEPGWQQPGSGLPRPDDGRPELHDVSAADRPGPRDPQPRPEDEPQPPAYLDHRQAPPKRLEPPTWAQEQ